MSAPLNILFLCSWYPHPGNPTQGIFIRRHAEALSLYHRVTTVFVASDPSVSQTRIQVSEQGNLKEIVCLYPKITSAIPLISGLRKYKRYSDVFTTVIDDLFSKNTFDLVHLNVVFPAGVAALKVVRKYNIPLFITEHWSGYYPEDGNYKGYLVRQVTRETIRRARAVMVISDKLSQAMQKHGLSNTYHLLNNVVDTACFRPSTELKKQTDVLQILHVSSLVEREKNIHGILMVALALKNNGRSFQLRIAGGEAARVREVQHQVKKLGLSDQVVLTGQASPQEVAAYMTNSDVFLLFSHFEGMPVVLLEAMACGLPVMSTAVGAVPQIIRPGFGIVLEASDAEACAGRLAAYQRSDFETSQAMHRFIEQHYGYASVAGQMTDIYRQAL